MQNQWMNEEQPTVPNNRPVVYSARNVQAYPPANSTVSNLPPPPPAPQSDAFEHESAARERARRRRVQPRNRNFEWAWVIIALTVMGVVLIASLSLFVFLRAAQETPQYMTTAVAALPTPVDARTDFSQNFANGQQITLSDGRSIVLTPWDGQSRFTVLVVGLDRRPGETGLAYRTDTMMLVSIDPVTQSLGILSIPRDLYVEVPGYSELQRVNTPMVLGELRTPGYGPELLKQTVQYNFGIRVHEYLAVDFNTFVTIVDTIGGVDIDVPYRIADLTYPDMYYGYDPFYMDVGLQHMDGLTALKYARTRHGDSDFNRAQRQQQVLYAIRDKVLSLNMLPQLLAQSPTLWNAVKDGVSTGLTFDQMIQLVWYLKDIESSNIRTGVVNADFTMPFMTAGGAAVLIPDRTALGPLMVEVFGNNYSQ